jgi:hypothetical protein
MSRGQNHRQRTALLAFASWLPLLVLGVSTASASATLSSSSVVPLDGHLRGQDFAATVTSVSWPTEAVVDDQHEEASPRHRFVTFYVTLSVNSDVVTPGSIPISASVTAGSQAQPLNLSTIDEQLLGSGSANSWPSASQSFTVQVPDTTHAVDLVLSESGFSQAFDLWTLKRVGASPLVLYRAPGSPTVDGTASGGFNLGFTNPADGFSSNDDVAVASAQLTYFAPDGSGTTPDDPNQAYLVLGIQSSSPNVPDGGANWGHYFAGFTPLPGDRLSFTPTGGTAVTASASSSAFSTTNAAANDDGLFDSVYWFEVPAITTGGTLSVTAGPLTGIEYLGFDGANGAGPVDLTSPAATTLSFPALPPHPSAQHRPPWVGAPLPATAAARTGATDTAPAPSAGHSAGFPIWLAVLILGVLAIGVVYVERLRRRRTKQVDVQTETDIPRGTPRAEEPANAPDAVLEEGVGASEPAPVAVPEHLVPERSVGPATDLASAASQPVVNVLGPIEIKGLRRRTERRILDELLVYLVCHDHRHLRSGQIRLGIWPTGSTRTEVSEKTLRNYLSELRTCVGSEHLPDASAREGYVIEGVESDWASFQRLTREADVAGGERANELRAEALDLVRGRPFEDIGSDAYEWVTEEHLDTQMTVAIAGCALRLAGDHLEAGHLDAAEHAARSGLGGAPDDFALWQIGARALAGREDRTALRRWMADASVHLDAADLARIEAGLDANSGAPHQSVQP